MPIKMIIPFIFLLFVVACSDRTAPSNQPVSTHGNISINSESTDVIARSDFIKSIFSKDYYPAEIMTVGLPGNMNEKANQITLKMKNGIKDNEEWYLNTLQNLEEGEAFPYDSRLGITENEYSFIKSLNNYMKLMKVGDTTIDIQSKEDSFNIKIGNSNVINNFTINVAKDSINTDLGEFYYSGEIKASDGQKITGKWNGYSWRLEEEYSKAFQISIGKFVNNDKKIIYIKLLEGGKESKEEFLIF